MGLAEGLKYLCDNLHPHREEDIDCSIILSEENAQTIEGVREVGGGTAALILTAHKILRDREAKGMPVTLDPWQSHALKAAMKVMMDDLIKQGGVVNA